MVTEIPARLSRTVGPGVAIADAAFAFGALALAAEATVHVQQYASLVDGVRWIGPLFLVNALASVAAIAALAYPRTRQLGALAGVVISAGALAALVVSYGRGLFGFYESGFRPAIAVAVISELAAVVLLSTGLAAGALLRNARDEGRR